METAGIILGMIPIILDASRALIKLQANSRASPALFELHNEVNSFLAVLEALKEVSTEDSVYLSQLRESQATFGRITKYLEREWSTSQTTWPFEAKKRARLPWRREQKEEVQKLRMELSSRIANLGLLLSTETM